MSCRDDDRESEEFASAMADVRRVENDRHTPEIIFRQPVPISRREEEVLRELDAIVDGSAPFASLDGEEAIEGHVPGVDPRTRKQLRRGDFTIQADLDLHGKDAETARALVERFVVESTGRGLRCVRIVHGRGKNSPGGVPVLKRNLPRWLSRGPARLAVLAYVTAAPKDGGAGASYVLLRR